MTKDEKEALLREPALKPAVFARVLEISKNSVYTGIKTGLFETIEVGKRGKLIVTAPIRKKLGIA
jgi:hypothetical protein